MSDAPDPLRPTDLPLAVYFPFADGALGYDCVACGARCCKREGGGFGLSRAELDALDSAFGVIKSWAHPTRSPAYFSIHSPGERCVFLEPDNSCRVQATLGYAAKPLVCRLFPANQFFLLRAAGQDLVLVADLNPLCPIVPATAARHRLCHGPLSQQLADPWTELCARAKKIDLDASRAEVAEIIRRELAWRDQPQEGPLALDTAFCDRIERQIGDDPRFYMEAAAAACTAMAARMRLLLLHSLASYQSAATLHSKIVALWPRIMLLWAHALSLHSQLARCRPTLQSAYDLATDSALAFWLLAQLDHQPRIESLPPKSATLRISASMSSATAKVMSTIYRRQNAGLSLEEILHESDIVGTETLLLLRAWPWELFRYLDLVP